MKVKDGKRMAPALLLLATFAFLATAFALPSGPALAAQQGERPLVEALGLEAGGDKAIPFGNVHEQGETLLSGEKSLARDSRNQPKELFFPVPASKTNTPGKNGEEQENPSQAESSDKSGALDAEQAKRVVDDEVEAGSSATRKPPYALVVVLLVLCAIGAAALALNEARRM